MGDEDDRAAARRDLVHLRQRLALEGGVADREHLVDEQDLRLEVGGDGEGEPHRHAARVALDRRVEEALDVGERDDLVEAAADLGAAHAEDRAVEEDVLAPGQLRVEAGADLEQRADPAGHLGPAGARLGDPREDLQQRALAGAVVADQADDFAVRRSSKRDVAQRPERRRPRLLAPRPAASAERPPRRLRRALSRSVP